MTNHKSPVSDVCPLLLQSCFLFFTNGIIEAIILDELHNYCEFKMIMTLVYFLNDFLKISINN